MRGLFIILIFGSSFAFGQVQDAEFWGGLGLKANLTKDLSVKYETQSRFYKNVSTLKNYYNEIAVNYEVIKRLKVGVSYRYARKNRETFFEGENRLCFNAGYGYKLGETGLRLKARARYQFAFDRLGTINEVVYPGQKHVFRLKMDLRYKNSAFKRVLPHVGYELFKDIQPSGLSGLSAYRVYGGLDFDLPARHELSLKYIYEFNNASVLNAAHIYMVQYNYELPSKLFKSGK